MRILTNLMVLSALISLTSHALIADDTHSIDEQMSDTDGIRTPGRELPEVLIETDDANDGSVWIGATNRGKKQSYLTAWVTIDAPVELVWTLITECQYAFSFMPNIKDCRIDDSGDEEGKTFEVIYHRLKPFALLPSVVNISKSIYTPYETIDFSRHDGDFIDYTGQWQLIKQDNDKVWIHYHVEGELSKLLSQKKEQATMRKDITTMLTGLRKLAEIYAPDYRAAQADISAP